jgi:dimethylaniline monooxygenase (N-oxide forming)
MNPAGNGKYRHAAEGAATRRATTFNSSSFHPTVWWANLLHQSVSGRISLEQKLFAGDCRFKAWPNYQGREGALPGFVYSSPGLCEHSPAILKMS